MPPAVRAARSRLTCLAAAGCAPGGASCDRLLDGQVLLRLLGRQQADLDEVERAGEAVTDPEAFRVGSGDGTARPSPVRLSRRDRFELLNLDVLALVVRHGAAGEAFALGVRR
jgi:hypothetical protein